MSTSAVTIERPDTAWRLLLASPMSVVCLGVVGLFVLFGLLSFLPSLQARAGESLPPIVLPDGTEVTEYAPPSLTAFPARILGTDILNRSVFYRVLLGCRTALLIAALTGTVAIAIGVTLGVLAGFFGGVIDDVVNWLIATLSAVPWILLVLALGFVLRGTNINVMGVLGREQDGSVSYVPLPELAIVILAMGLTDWVGVCRLIRAEVLKQRSLDYVTAARALGLSRRRILFRHILPNTLHLVIITFTLGAVGYVQAEVALTFLGIGITDAPSWGRMIDDAKLELLRGVWWQFAAATVAIAALCLSLSLLGDTLRDILDPRTRSRR